MCASLLLRQSTRSSSGSNNYCNFKVVRIMLFQLLCDTYKLWNYLSLILMTKSQELLILLGFIVYITMERNAKFQFEVCVVL